MPTAECIPLAERGVLRIRGDDARSYLQGLISNDVQRVGPERAFWAAFLSPQGRYLHDFFLCEHAGELLLDGERARLADLQRRLSIYKLRSRVSIEPAGDTLSVWALIGSAAAARFGLPAEQPGAAAWWADGVVYVDPRLANAGLRAILPAETGEAALLNGGVVPGDRADYERLRIGFGLPDGSRDLLVEKSLLLEGGFDELHGIDWQKGCYLGQELTARSRYRGLVKRRLVPVAADQPLPPAGTPVTFDGETVGELRSSVDGIGLAMLRVDALTAATGKAGSMSAGDVLLVPRIPDWAVLPSEQQK